ncbi:MAG: hypothetical protein B7Y28_22780 [Polaromonas sp. 16-63-31]|nr:MAG: hypothetical protein B7Y60_23290 [Polaromonas sp. 35-63-35]OYZ15045.1 MAG: hypothetical protein B7Y28_22780 [Polaromonas sp. 16-63-31]OZA45850.1 MAG: hypothetical protein B7X88_24070 [Polaromonas sp. 17-63-33]
MHGGTAEGEQYDSMLRLGSLTQSLDKLGEEADAELYRHFPVAAIAVLETHFKSVVSLTINAGSPYLERGLVLAKDRLKSAVDVLPSLHRKTVTLGEFIAHSLPFYALSSLEVPLTGLLGDNFKELIRNAVNPRAKRNEYADQVRVVADVEALWEDLAKTFTSRHILAHEAATKYEVNFQDARMSLNAVSKFTEALDAVLWSSVWAGEPLTQYEMNMHTWESYKKTRALLAASLRKGLAIAADDKERAKFGELHLDWKWASRRWNKFEESQWHMGSIRPMMAAISLDRTHEQRLNSINAWIENKRPE